MRQAVARLLSEYGMILVLLVLCAFLSAVTYREQSPTGGAAGHQLASAIQGAFQGAPRVLIVVRDLPEDRALAEQTRLDLESAGGKVLGVVKGEPRDAREALAGIAAKGEKLDVVAATQTTGDWLVFSALNADFPTLGEPRVMTPKSYRWPSFLKSENLLNIANQIAVIAIVAIGMTMVIITGGIDLSVGSLIALSAVLSTILIRDVAGGASATSLGMTAACLVAIVICGVIGGFSGAMITRFDVPPFIVTLAMMLVCSGLSYIASKGVSIYEIPESFVWLGRGANLFGLPNAVLLMFLLYMMAHVLMSRMRLGRYLYAVGGQSRSGEAFRRACRASAALRLCRLGGFGRHRRGDHGLAVEEWVADVWKHVRALRYRGGRRRRGCLERRRRKNVWHAHWRVHNRRHSKRHEFDEH